MFVEIGSKDEDWGREDAAELWADVLERNLILQSEPPEAPAAAGPAVVVCSLGGGHYTPKSNDLLRHRADVRMGHILANYCFGGPPEDWQRGVEEAVRSTQAAYGGGEEGDVSVVVYVDKKAFKSAQRAELVAFLESKGWSYGFKEAELVAAATTATGGDKVVG